ncbi:MAG: 30S ribosomal protein S8e [Candidatus Diapherotrites archaeon]|nr:30S ribosomal protein S8e [Candidatus Diapherotrites archaeon]
MSEWRTKSKRTNTGAIRTTNRRRKKKASEKGGFPTETKFDNKKPNEVRTTRSSSSSTNRAKLKEALYASVRDAKGTFKKVKITGVLENNANKHFVRRNVITKGCVVDTELGKAQVRSRPGQTGAISAVLI